MAVSPDGGALHEPTTPLDRRPEEVREGFQEAGGLRLRYLEGGRGSGLPLLLLHGWPTWSEVWLPVARRLGSAHPWRALDLPCQGGSDLLPGRSRTLPEYRAALRAAVDAAPWPRFGLVGNSMGGTLALMLALDRPERIASVAVLDAAGLTPKLPGRTARMYLPFLLPSLFAAPGPARVRRLLVRAVFHDPRFAEGAWTDAMVRGWADRPRRRALIATAFALRRPDASVAGVLERLRLPVLIASGRQDPQFPWPSAQAAAGRVPGARFELLDAAGHFPMVEQPDAVSAILSSFFSASRGSD